MTRKELEEAHAMGDKMSAKFAAHLETLPTGGVEQYFAEAREKIKGDENIEIYKAIGLQAGYELLKRRGYRAPWTATQVNDILAALGDRKDHVWSDNWKPIQ